jgi:hypothetical protein
MSEEQALKDYLLGCGLCGAYLSAGTGETTLREHNLGNRTKTARCPGSGDIGVDLGLKKLYTLDDWGGLTLVTGSTGGTIRVLCPSCEKDFSLPEPPAGVFDRRMSAHIFFRCRKCRTRIAFDEIREGPQGKWLPRNGGDSW